MAGAVSVETGAFFRAAHENLGVRFAFGAGVVAITGEGGRAGAIRLSDGREMPADLVVVGIGVLPNQE
ncbi:FAD-dependent oxidoreductase, partial [Methylobacterium sp. WL103]|uniref:FAD-dependent oxidoreductase n=1 Tax=Methylobacterium sp. WL103 TaxID=2603891 RepID=UPI0032B243BC